MIRNDPSRLLKEAFDEAFLRSFSLYKDPYRCYAASGVYFNIVYYRFINGCRETAEEISRIDITI